MKTTKISIKKLTKIKLLITFIYKWRFWKVKESKIIKKKYLKYNWHSYWITDTILIIFNLKYFIYLRQTKMRMKTRMKMKRMKIYEISCLHHLSDFLLYLLTVKKVWKKKELFLRFVITWNNLKLIDIMLIYQ